MHSARFVVQPPARDRGGRELPASPASVPVPAPGHPYVFAVLMGAGPFRIKAPRWWSLPALLQHGWVRQWFLARPAASPLPLIQLHDSRNPETLTQTEPGGGLRPTGGKR
jgi:hypothetical protein